MAMTLKYKNFFPILITLIAILALRFSFSERSSQLQDSKQCLISYAPKIKTLFPKADFTSESRNQGGVICISGHNGKTLGYVLSTESYSSHITGYAGPTPVLVAFSPTGIITGMRILDNTETPSFNEKVRSSSILKEFYGLDPAAAATKHVDTVTGATFTSKAIINSIQYALSMIEPERAFNITSSLTLSALKTVTCPMEKSKNFPETSRGVLANITIFLAAFLCFSFFYKQKKLRTTILFISMVWLGFIKAELISIDLLATWLIKGVFTGASLGIFFMAVLNLIACPTTGRSLYCFYICPFGAIQEFTNRLSPWKITIPAKTFVFLKKIKFIFLLIISIMFFIFPFLDLTKAEPFASFVFSSRNMVAFFLAGSSLILSLFIFRPWCCFFCPTGAFFELFTRKRSVNNSNDVDVKKRS